MELLSQRADQGGAADVAQALVELFGQVVAIAGRLEQGRSFLHAHTSEALARERTDLELGALEADAAQLRQIAASRRSLERRAVVSRKVAADVGRLSGRLLAASEEIEALYARIVESVASPELGYEVRAYVTAAQAAMDAYEATAEEMSALDS
jgi:hypothetical protein